MFTIAARGSHRPRAVAEHHDLMIAIVEGRGEEARALSLTMVENATTDIVRIRATP